jgi:hypothetical protein
MARNTLDADFVYSSGTVGEAFSVNESAEIWEIKMVLQGYAEGVLSEVGVSLPKVSDEFSPGNVAVLEQVVNKKKPTERFCRQLWVFTNDEFCLPIMERRNLLVQIYRSLIELGEIVE